MTKKNKGSSLAGWFDVIHEQGKQDQARRRERIANFNLDHLPYMAKQYIVGAASSMRIYWSYGGGRVPFTDAELLAAIKQAAADLTEDDLKQE
jgi:hypothetical protein